jgi:ATP-dependent RNA helicase DDX5/DBP2
MERRRERSRSKDSRSGSVKKRKYSRDRSSSSSSSSRKSSRSRSRRSHSSSSRGSKDSAKPSFEEKIKITPGTSKKLEAKAITDFADVDFPKEFFKVFKDLGFVKPTPIQANAIPIALENQDVIGIAKTGSGKTLSFALPALMALEDEKRYYKKKDKRYDNRRTPRALVLAPTRELCTQIYEAAKPFARGIGIDIACVYGGAPHIPQKEALSSGVDLLIATPGRLFDFVTRKQVFLDKVFYFVLDEADRMLDMGFLPQVQQIIEHIKGKRQTLLWSATWPKEVEELSKKVCKNDPVMIKVGSESLTVNPNITQEIQCMEDEEKFRELIKLIKDCTKHDRDKILIFANTKLTCDNLTHKLEKEGFDANAIHSDRTQSAREAIISKFKSGRKNILVATDVASRGLGKLMLLSRHQRHQGSHQLRLPINHRRLHPQNRKNRKSW